MVLISAQKHSGDPSKPTRIQCSTPEDLVDTVRLVPVPSEVIVELDTALLTTADGIDVDELVAVASVLVVLGVEHVETSHPERVRRIFDMHRAISAGTIEVLAE